MLQSNFVTAPTSDAQRNGMKFYLERKDWWFEVKQVRNRLC
ncbi:hypothetical protein DZB94_10845 [Bacillus sp. AW]|nr:hypothetical protein [Bacillus wiedmannii]RFB13317.1 hypothetical protein DZB88_12855 [Bacillus sp. OE]RFB75483.1 hypothetical protein DZB94_10845 [Bacillus sp. AW]HDR6299098.1 hypothetical protein [Bacillus cereus]HDR6302410.1 hypothetical protein [Bacillus cereus]